ncbi:MAG TPA: PhzF family phenazine biosynthesis protein [Opitutaceae bacterium]|nr:PhzF family phenazine biosynthesis protein [Opitutaceae bacterium]
MEAPIYWIDAFTDKVFGGNPAAVVPLDSWPEDRLLQRIAFENGLSETAYFIRSGPARADLRWFTPSVEVDLCGHATLAAAHVLFNELGQKESPFVFDTRSGPLSAARRGAMIELDFPARPAVPSEPSPELLRGLGREPRETLKSERMWLCVYASAGDIAALSPDHGALAAASPGRIIVTAPGADCDFVSRFFAPEAGIPEDPVTGSAHSTLVPYWAGRLGKPKLHARQVSGRGGELWCELDRDRVRMAGHSAAYLRGRISV